MYWHFVSRCVPHQLLKTLRRNLRNSYLLHLIHYFIVLSDVSLAGVPGIPARVALTLQLDTSHQNPSARGFQQNSKFVKDNFQIRRKACSDANSKHSSSSPNKPEKKKKKSALVIIFFSEIFTQKYTYLI